MVRSVPSAPTPSAPPPRQALPRLTADCCPALTSLITIACLPRPCTTRSACTALSVSSRHSPACTPSISLVRLAKPGRWRQWWRRSPSSPSTSNTRSCTSASAANTAAKLVHTRSSWRKARSSCPKLERGPLAQHRHSRRAAARAGWANTLDLSDPHPAPRCRPSLPSTSSLSRALCGQCPSQRLHHTWTPFRLLERCTSTDARRPSPLSLPWLPLQRCYPPPARCE